MALQNAESFFENITRRLPTKTQVEEVHSDLSLIEGTSDGYINEHELDAAIGSVKTYIGYQDSVTISQIAVVCAEKIASAHAFIDGNKRTGLASMLIFLANCGLKTALTDLELEDFMVDLVNEKYPIAHFINLIELSLYKVNNDN